MAVTQPHVDDLAAALPRASGTPPDQIAESLLDRDGRVYSLVGLVDGASRAVYYDWPCWLVRTVPATDGGPTALTAPRSVDRRHLGRVETFVTDRGPERWDWLHPRYRWVFER